MFRRDRFRDLRNEAGPERLGLRALRLELARVRALRTPELSVEIDKLRAIAILEGMQADLRGRRYRLLHTVLVLASAALAAAAGFTALPDDVARWVASFLAFFSAFIGFLTAALNPLSAGRKQAILATGWNRLADEAASLLRRSDSIPEDRLEGALRELFERRDQLQMDAIVGHDESEPQTRQAPKFVVRDSLPRDAD